jgi:hypothetical protein
MRGQGEGSTFPLSFAVRRAKEEGEDAAMGFKRDSHAEVAEREGNTTKRQEKKESSSRLT